MIRFLIIIPSPDLQDPVFVKKSHRPVSINTKMQTQGYVGKLSFGGAEGGIRTHERLRDRLLKPAPLTWLGDLCPRIVRVSVYSVNAYLNLSCLVLRSGVHSRGRGRTYIFSAEELPM